MGGPATRDSARIGAEWVIWMTRPEASVQRPIRDIRSVPLRSCHKWVDPHKVGHNQAHMAPRGRPPLTDEQLRAKIAAYCQRYGVSEGADGLPPFPSGQRETRQHREWLSVYKAQRRARQRAAAVDRSPDAAAAVEPGQTRSRRHAQRISAACPVCDRPVRAGDGVALASAGAPLHARCAELVRLAQDLGPEGLARLGRLLWPDRR